MLGLLAAIAGGSGHGDNGLGGSRAVLAPPPSAKEKLEQTEPKAPENFKGEGGAQTLIGKFGEETIEISSPSVQVKGAPYGPVRRQVKPGIVYNQPNLCKPNKPGCVVTIGEKNIVQVKGH